MRTSLPLAVSSALALIAAPAQAQMVPIDSVKPGNEVRVWSTQPKLRGWRLEYVGRTDTSLVLGEQFGSARIENFHNEIALAALERMEVRRGSTAFSGRDVSRGFLRGAAVGMGAGVFAGLVASSMATEKGETVIACVGLGALGTLAGGIVGAAVGTRSVAVWTQVRIP